MFYAGGAGLVVVAQRAAGGLLYPLGGAATRSPTRGG